MNREFLTWIDPLNKSLTTSKKYAGGVREGFSDLFWVKVFYTNPRWLFTSDLPSKFDNDQFRIRIITKMWMKNNERLWTCLKYKNENLYHFCITNIPEIYLLLV